MNKKRIIVDGDSWVFGSEILDPNIKKSLKKDDHPGVCDWKEENDSYRIPRIFSTHLGKLFDSDIINLSWPADDNGTILNRIITYVTTNYINKKVPTDDLFLIVGWSSPERTFFWYKDDMLSHKFRLWPQDLNVTNKGESELWKTYVEYFWNQEEYLPRYVMNVLQFQNFCEVNNIKWLCFNSFYQTPNSNLNMWIDLDIKNELKNLNIGSSVYQDSRTNGRSYYPYEYNSIWETIDENRFYKKNQINNTFKSFIEKHNNEDAFNGWHPSPKSHEIWAKELYNYIIEKKLME